MANSEKDIRTTPKGARRPLSPKEEKKAAQVVKKIGERPSLSPRYKKPHLRN